MSNETIARVEAWYSANEKRLIPRCKLFQLKIVERNDKARGGVTIAAETENNLGSITFWNKGDVCSMVVDKASDKHRILDDRMTNQGDVPEDLLERFLRELLSEANPRQPT
jgi:hypothetical protein